MPQTRRRSTAACQLRRYSISRELQTRLGLEVPSNATNTASAAGVIDFNVNKKNIHGYVNGADSLFLNIALAPTTGHLLDSAVSSGNTLAHDSGIATSTVTTNAASLTNTALMTGAGSNASQTPSTTLTLSASGVLQVAAAGSVGSADTGSPAFTFAANKTTFNSSTPASALFDLSGITNTAGFKVPSNATNTASAAGVIDFDVTNKNFHGYVNGADSLFLNIALAPTTGHLLDSAVSSGNTLAHDSGIATSTVTTNAASLTNTALMTGAGSNASQTPSTTSTLSASGVLQVAAAGSVGSADTGSPAFTFAANKTTFNSSTPASALFDLSGITNTAGFKVPSNATNTASAAGVIDFDVTNKNFHGYVNGADSIFVNFAPATPLATNVIPKAAVSSGNTLITNSSISDNGTVVSTAEPLTTSGLLTMQRGMVAEALQPARLLLELAPQRVPCRVGARTQQELYR